MDDETLSLYRRKLETGQLRAFRDPLDPAVPRVAAGCYTIWDSERRLTYAGMAGRSLTADIIDAAESDPGIRVTGLRDRLASHRAGRRSGDQFCVYVCGRLVLPTLTREQIAEAAAGTRRLDDEVRRFIHDRLGYRWVATSDGCEAFELEVTLLTEGIAGSLPMLNPRRIR